MLRYLDASIVIDTTEPLSSRNAVTIAAIESFPLDEFRVSDLVRLECFIRPTRENDVARLKQLHAFFASVPILEMPSSAFDRAIRLRSSYSWLKTADALHLATSLHHGCGEFWTNDLRLTKLTLGLVFRSF